MILLNIKDVAAQLGVSARHVYRLIDSGELTHTLVGKRAVRVSSEALAAFLKSRTCQSEKIREDGGTLRFATGGKEFIESALKTRQRHRRSSSKPKSARIYSLPGPVAPTT